MKKFLILFSTFLLLTTCTALAEDTCNNKRCYDFSRDYRCTQLINKIRFQKNTLYNVLGLSPEQQELKDEIEVRRQAETQPYKENYECQKHKLRELAQTSYQTAEFKKQRKVTKKAWKALQKKHKKFDKEFTKILCSTQKAKFKEIVRLTKRDIKYCRLNRKCCTKDPYMNTFGKNDAKPLCDVCNKHEKHHILNRKCKFIEELEQ